MTAKEVSPEYICIHEKRIGKTENRITSLEERADFKDEKISELNDNIKEMDSKLDKLNENFTQFMLQSNKGDTELELRLKSYETKLATTEQQLKNNEKQLKSLKDSIKEDKEESQRNFNNNILKLGVIFSIITILLNILFNVIH